MKAKNKRTTTPSIRDRVNAHTEAKAEARKHAFDGIEHANAGRMRQARAAEKRAEAARREMIVLETSVRVKSPHE